MFSGLFLQAFPCEKKMSRKRASQELNWWSEFYQKMIVIGRYSYPSLYLSLRGSLQLYLQHGFRTTDGSTTQCNFAIFWRPSVSARQSKGYDNV